MARPGIPGRAITRQPPATWRRRASMAQCAAGTEHTHRDRGGL